MTRAVSLLLLAFISMGVLFIPAFIAQIIRHFFLIRLKPEFSNYLFGLAKAFDYLFAYLIFGVHGHTVSAIVFKKQIGWAIIFIDWLFQDDTHCMKQFLYEFKKKVD